MKKNTATRYYAGEFFTGAKQRKKIVAIILAALAICAAGCPNGSDSDNPDTTLKASFVGPENATNFSRYLAERFTGKSAGVDADTKIVVVTKDLNDLSAGDISSVNTVYDNGGVVAVVNPNVHKIREFQAAIGHSDSLGTISAASIGTESLCDAYIFNNKGDHLLVDTSSNNNGYTSSEKSEYASGDDAAAEPADKEISITTAAALTTKDDYSAIIDEVIKWINNPPGASEETARAARAAADDDLADLTSAATYTRIFNISSAGNTYYDGSAMNGSAAITDTQYVWQCYSPSHDKDYYIVKDYIVIPNSTMYRGIWHHYHKAIEWKECALYMTSVSVNSKLLGKDGQPVPLGDTSSGGATIPESTPQTENNVTNVTSGMEWNLGGDVSYNGEEGTTAGVSGGVTFQKSTSYDIQDVGVLNNSSSDGPNAKFDYTTNKLSDYSTSHNAMQNPAELAYNTAQFTHYWRWEVNNPKTLNGGANGGGSPSDSGRFGMNTDFNIQYEEAAAWGAAGSTKRWHLNKEDTAPNFTWWFPTLNRDNTVFN